MNSEHFSFYRKMCTVINFSRFQNNCGGYSAFPPTVINSCFGFYVYDFFVKFINGLQLQRTSQIKFVALFTGSRTVRLRKLIQIIITSINSLIGYHNLTILSLALIQLECVTVVNRIIKNYSLAIKLAGEVQAGFDRRHFCFRSDESDEFQNENTFILDWRLVYRCKIKTNEVTKYKRYQNITLYQCMVGSFDIKCRKILSTFF